VVSEKHISEGRRKRTEEIERLRQVFGRVEGGVLADFVGLKVKEVDELRRRFRQAGGEMRVLKNNLTRLAVENTPLKSLDQHLVGPTSVAFGHSDLVAVAKVAIEFAKEHEALKVKGGFLRNQVLDREQVVELSQLGGRQEILGRLLGAINAPAQQLLGVLNAVPQKFLGVLQAKAEQLEGAKS
jgi:large subunit ribosomal protein L10